MYRRATRLVHCWVCRLRRCDAQTGNHRGRSQQTLLLCRSDPWVAPDGSRLFRSGPIPSGWPTRAARFEQWYSVIESALAPPSAGGGTSPLKVAERPLTHPHRTRLRGGYGGRKPHCRPGFCSPGLVKGRRRTRRLHVTESLRRLAALFRSGSIPSNWLTRATRFEQMVQCDRIHVGTSKYKVRDLSAHSHGEAPHPHPTYPACGEGYGGRKLHCSPGFCRPGLDKSCRRTAPASRHSKSSQTGSL